MLAVMDPATFGQNLYLLIGGLVALGFLFVVLVTSYTLLKVWIWRIQQRRAAAEVARRTRQPDGTLKPPAVAGACEACGRADRKVVCPPTGKLLCQPCYEALWLLAQAAPTGPPA